MGTRFLEKVMKIHWFYQSLLSRASGLQSRPEVIRAARGRRVGGAWAARGAEVKAVPLATKTTNGNPKRKASGKNLRWPPKDLTGVQPKDLSDIQPKDLTEIQPKDLKMFSRLFPHISF